MSLVLSGCAAGSAAETDAAPSASPSVDPSAPGGPADLEALGIQDWSSIDELDWTVSDAPVAGWGPGAVEALGDPLAKWMQAAQLDPAMWEVADGAAAVELVAASLPPKFGESYREIRAGRVGHIQADGWALASGVSIADSRHTLAWNFEPATHVDGDAMLVGTLAMRSAWLLQAGDGEPTWVMAMREVTIKAALPAQLEASKGSIGTSSKVLGADPCIFAPDGRIAPYLDADATSASSLDAAFAAFTDAPAGTYETVEQLSAEVDPLVAGLPEPVC